MQCKRFISFISLFIFFKQSSSEISWCETKAKIISHKSTHTHWLKELPLPVSHWHRKSQTAPWYHLRTMQGSAGTSHGYPAFQSSHSLSHSLSSYWTGICYLAGSSCQILFWVHNLSCSLFLVFHFPFLCVFCLSCISILASPLLLKPKSCLLGDHLHRSSTLLLLLDWVPPPPPNSQIFGKNQLTGFQEASTPLSKSTKTNPCRQSGKTKKKEKKKKPTCSFQSWCGEAVCRMSHWTKGKMKRGWIHPDFWTVSHNYRGKWCVLLLLHTAHTH